VQAAHHVAPVTLLLTERTLASPIAQLMPPVCIVFGTLLLQLAGSGAICGSAVAPVVCAAPANCGE
jgi:hypothetical protein